MSVGTIEVELTNETSNEVEVTLRGEASQIVRVLVGGMPREALVQISHALSAEIAKRST